MFARISVRVCPVIMALVLAMLSCGPAPAAGKKKVAPANPQTTSMGKLEPPSSSTSVPTHSLTPGFSVKPSEVALPSDVPIGQYLRIIRPFPNWTLICDENLAKKQKVCNVTQTIAGPDGATVFSWSLAATEGGQPFFILRTPPGLVPAGAISLDPGDGGPVVSVAVKGCDQKVCIAYQQVGPRLRAAVGKKLAVEISYTIGSPPNALAFRAPLDGLDAALAAI